MFEILRSLAGILDVRINRNIVTVSGVKKATIEGGMKKVFGSDKIAAHIFKIKSNSFSFQEWFLPDVAFALQEIVNSPKSYADHKRTCKQILDQFYEKTWLGRINTEAPKRLDRSKLRDMVFTPLDFQEEFFDYFEKNVYAYNLKGFLFAGAAGSGKAQPDSALVKIPNGWKPIGAIRTGDLVVTPDGEHAVVSGVFPQGMKKIYEISTVDGRRTQACREHLWEITIPDQSIFREPKVVNTQAVLSLIGSGIPVFIPTTICCSPTDIPLSADPEKCSPRELIEASYAQKEAFFVAQVGRKYRYLNNWARVTGQDRKDFIALVRSFGGVIGPITEEISPDILPYYFDSLVEIENVLLAENQYARCIMVEDPRHLYVTDQYIATHNTFTSCALAHCSGSDKVIVVCPNNALDRVWKDSALTVFKQPQSVWISDGKTPFTGKERFLVCHYEWLSKLRANLDKISYQRLTVILDESHNLNEADSGRTQKFISLCEEVDAAEVIWLSGTPIKALSTEAIPLIRCIDPLFTPEVEDIFKAIFRGENNKAVSILKNRIGLVSFKVAKDRLGLKEPLFTNYKVAFPGAEEFTLTKIREKMTVFIQQRDIYYKTREKADLAYYQKILDRHAAKLSSREEKAEFDRYVRNANMIRKTQGMGCSDEMKAANLYELRNIMPGLSAEDRIKFKESKTIYKYLTLKIQGECLGQIVGRTRIACHVELAKQIKYAPILESTEKKTVVFSSFVDVLKAAEVELQAQQYSPMLVYGETTSKLAQIVQQFGDDESVNPLVATYASLSTAVPLIMADTMILIDVPFRDYILQQAVSRIHRLGQVNDTHIFTIVLDTGDEPNISTRTVDILRWSQQQIESILGIKSPFEIKDGEEISLETMENLNDIDLTQVVDPFFAGLKRMDQFIDPDVVEVSVENTYLSW
jgi:hypothetical protein